MERILIECYSNVRILISLVVPEAVRVKQVWEHDEYFGLRITRVDIVNPYDPIGFELISKL